MKIDRTDLPSLILAARRQRAHEVYRLVIAPLIAAFKEQPVRRTRMLRRSAFG